MPHPPACAPRPLPHPIDPAEGTPPCPSTRPPPPPPRCPERVLAACVRHERASDQTDSGRLTAPHRSTATRRGNKLTVDSTSASASNRSTRRVASRASTAPPCTVGFGGGGSTPSASPELAGVKQRPPNRPSWKTNSSCSGCGLTADSSQPNNCW